MKLKIHSKVPNFKLPNQEGEIIELNNLKKNTSKIVLEKPKKINVDNSDIPPSTLKLIEEAEKSNT